MGDWLSWIADNLWVIWVVGAAVLAGVEVLTLDLTFLMLAAGALAGGVVAAVGIPVGISAVVAVVVAVAMLGAVRPVALRHLKQGPSVRTGIAALVGRKAIVTERVDPHGGRVKIGGEVWSARSFDEHAVIEPGRTVDVISIEGATAFVYESEGPWDT